MAHRPYPNADRALNNLRRQQAVYRYGRVPQRYVLGFDLAEVTQAETFPVDEYRLSTRRPLVVSGRP
jgi:hypothetical protein